MAIVTHGSIAGQVSGRIGGVVYTRNRGGSVARNGVIPTNKRAIAQQHSRATLAQLARHWRRLTAAQRRAWASWAEQNPTTNRLGRAIRTTGAQAFTSISFIRALANMPMILTPPTGPPPPALESISLSADIGAGNVEIAFTPTPLPWPLILIIRADPGTAPARQPKQGQMPLTASSSALKVSPQNIEAHVRHRFGILQVGQRLAVQVSQFDLLTGLESLALHDNAVVVST